MKTKVWLCSVVVMLSCDPTEIPMGGPDDVARYTESLIRFRLDRYDSMSALEDSSTKLESAEAFAERAYYDCQQRAAHPVIDGTVGIPRLVLKDCPDWDDATFGIDSPTTCDQAICASIASHCVAETLTALAEQVDDFVSTQYPQPADPFDHELTVPPQAAAANATLVEVASTWAGRAIMIAGENLREGTAVPARNGVTYDAVCGAGTSAGDLFDSTNSIVDPLGDSMVTVTYAEAFLSTLFDAADLQNELVGSIERHFAAVASSEHSRNSSPSVAARYAWIEGRTSRARAAHALLGGDRESGLHRVPDGYGSLGDLNTAEVAALETIRATGIDPAELQGTPSDIVDAVVAAVRSQNGLMVSEYDETDLLDNRGMTETDFLNAARWLDNAISVFELNSTATLDGVPSGRFAATSTFEVVPPNLDLIAAARHGTVDPPDYVFVPNRMLDSSYPVLSSAASLDYAADVAGEVGGQINDASFPSGVPTATTDAMKVVIAAGAGPAVAMRTGRIELCSVGDFVAPDVFIIRYAGFEDDLVAVSSTDGLRCALTGTVHGADCDVSTYEFGSDTTTMEQTAGVGLVHNWSEATKPDAVYVLRRIRNDLEQVIGYEPVGGGRFIDAVIGGGCVLAPVVPTVDQAAARLVRPDEVALGRAGTSCAGIPADQRLPLEDELSDDGDQFESSWRHYLNLASQAATEADRLGEAVIQNGLDIEQRVELAASAIEGVCGQSIDIDFLSATALGAGSLCTAAADGDLVNDGTTGYICQGGEPLPHAMETIRVRAGNDDPDAIALLECIGDVGIEEWVSLGSTPLCLWEDTDGSACVGASEAGVKCPVVSRLGPCGDQLEDAIDAAEAALMYAPNTLTAVTVDTNLGIFADTIRPPVGGMFTEEPEDDGGAPPCEDLRVIREVGSTDLERAAAAGRLLSSEWLSQNSIRAEARRLAWEALPYDYGVVTRDGEPFVWTGDPGRSSTYPTATWPCGATLEEGLENMSGTGLEECALDPFHGTPDAGPLGCAYVDDCTATGVTMGMPDIDPLLARVRMNQRVGRAVTTLRLITALGFEGMKLPTNLVEVGRRDQNVDRYRFFDDSERSMFAPDGFTDITGVDVSSPIAGIVAGEVRARDTTGAIEANGDRDGTGYCASVVPCDPGLSTCTQVCDNPMYSISDVGGCAVNNMGYLWTYLSQSAYDDPSSCTETCLRDNTCATCFRIFAPCFVGHIKASNERRAPFLAQSFEGEDGEPTSTAVARATTRVWRGVGPGATTAATRSVIHQVFDQFIRGLDPDEAIPDFDPEDYFERYWSDNSNIRLMEHVTYADVMDGLELACASARREFEDPMAGVGGVSNDPCSPDRLGDLEASSEADIAQLEDHLRCSANLLESNAELLTMRNVPNDVVASIQAEFGGATIPELSGSRGVLIGEITADIIALRNYRLQIGRTLRELSSHINTLRTELQRQGIQRQQIQLRLASEISQQITACISASSPSISVGATGQSASINPGAAIATCINTAIQVGIAVESAKNSVALVGLDTADAFNRFTTAFQALADNLGHIEIELAAAGHRLQSRSAQLETGRQEATRALGQAMLFSSDAAGRQLRVNTLLRRRFTTSQDRYERARDHAMKMAYLAKLALEQRLGVRLSDLRADLTLVEAPSSWESRLCTMTGIQFERVRDGSEGALESYADQYIGDYVERLARTAESYRLDFPFHEGSDSAVISMRDDLLDVRDECPGGIAAANVLASSSDLQAAAWSTDDTCVAVPLGNDPEGTPVTDIRNCVQLTHGSAIGAPLNTPSLRTLGHAEGWRVRFGPEAAGGVGQDSALTTTRLSQHLTSVEPGTYIVSWYAAQVGMSPIAPADAVEVAVNGTEATLTVSSEAIHGGTCDTMVNGGWCRYYSLLDVRAPSDITVALTPNETDMGTVTSGEITGPQEIDIAGLQLEDVSSFLRAGVDPMTITPSPFVETNEIAGSRLPVCEDTDGDVFRSGWRYRCERLCSTGFRTDCPEETAVYSCFWERSFEFSSEEALSRGALGHTGFAIGNYNYRTDGVSLNFVGTNIRRCEDDPLPSSCYGSGFVNYSIEHLGPYTVVNHQGENYSAPLFTGLIEYARGLAGERFLTNPLSSADRALIEPYRRGEFRGRPLTGTYIVRIWDDGVVDFDAIEDIQILLDYRYWTRFR